MRSIATDIKDESIDMISTIKMFSKEKYHLNSHKAATKNALVHNNIVVLIRCQREFLAEILRYFLVAYLLYLNISDGEHTNITAGTFMTFYLLMEKYVSNFNKFNIHFNYLNEDIPAIERYVEFMKQNPKIKSGKRKVKDLKGNIEFRGVGFSYPNRPGEVIFKNLNLNIQCNKMTAIVGDSGSGKSTITKLLMRLYDPQSGTICIGGVNIRDMQLNEYHGKVSVVPQNPDLINSTILDNIAYGDLGSTLGMLQHLIYY